MKLSSQGDDAKPRETHMTDLRILVVADDPLARAGLGALLVGQDGHAVVGQVSGHEDISAALDVYRPDVLLWDLGPDGATGVEHIAGAHDASVPIVALVADESRAWEARVAGALGLLPRDADSESVVAALAAVSRGMLVLDPGMAPTALRDGGRPSPGAKDLTPRELEVLRLLADGLPNKTIAHRLEISEHTVKFHVNSVMTKLGAQSRTDAVMRATRLGLVLI